MSVPLGAHSEPVVLVQVVPLEDQGKRVGGDAREARCEQWACYQQVQLGTTEA